MKSRTGTLCTLKLAHPCGKAAVSLCLLHHQPESLIRLLMAQGCQMASIQHIAMMVPERHSIASWLIFKTLGQVNLE